MDCGECLKRIVDENNKIKTKMNLEEEITKIADELEKEYFELSYDNAINHRGLDKFKLGEIAQIMKMQRKLIRLIPRHPLYKLRK